MKDPYKILGTNKSASSDEIKQTYRRMARLRHPDLFPGNPHAEEEFKDIAEAYQLLSDVTLRSKFDRGDIDMHGNRKKSSNSNKRKSPFDRFYKDKKRSEGMVKNRVKINGANVEYSLTISFADSCKGVIKHISMTNGKRLKINVPSGTRDQQTLRLKGQGMAGLGGGTSGDALIDIHVQADPTFQLDGNDVHINFPVTLPEAVLGTKIDVPTMNGPVTLTVPEGSNTGSILRLKGKGIKTNKSVNGDNETIIGDQYVTLRVVLPTKPDQKFKNFIKTWFDEKPYKIPGRN